MPRRSRRPTSRPRRRSRSPSKAAYRIRSCSGRSSAVCWRSTHRPGCTVPGFRRTRWTSCPPSPRAARWPGAWRQPCSPPSTGPPPCTGSRCWPPSPPTPRSPSRRGRSCTECGTSGRGAVPVRRSSWAAGSWRDVAAALRRASRVRAAAGRVRGRSALPRVAPLRPAATARHGDVRTSQRGSAAGGRRLEDVTRAVIQNSVRDAVFLLPPGGTRRRPLAGCWTSTAAGWLVRPGCAVVCAGRPARPGARVGFLRPPPRWSPAGPARPGEAAAGHRPRRAGAARRRTGAGACALAVRLSDGPGVIFRQERIGQDGRPFTLLKFRTLRPARRARVGDPVERRRRPSG